MKIKTWLTVNDRGTVKATKNQPALGVDEISLALSLELPDELFTKPRIQASVTVPQEAVVVHEINAEVTDNIQEIIKERTGLDVIVRVIAEEDETN